MNSMQMGPMQGGKPPPDARDPDAYSDGLRHGLMRGMDMGFTHFKFFPAMASGGLPALKALAAPFFQCKFCPTGGISEATAPEWLAFDPVLCVGGSWVVGKGAPDKAAITAAAKAASALAGQPA